MALVHYWVKKIREFATVADRLLWTEFPESMKVHSMVELSSLMRNDPAWVDIPAKLLITHLKRGDSKMALSPSLSAWLGNLGIFRQAACDFLCNLLVGKHWTQPAFNVCQVIHHQVSSELYELEQQLSNEMLIHPTLRIRTHATLNVPELAKEVLLRFVQGQTHFPQEEEDDVMGFEVSEFSPDEQLKKLQLLCRALIAERLVSGSVV
eukprot:Platyproteum_vivax@DN15126_c0_g1_i1.p1